MGKVKSLIDYYFIIKPHPEMNVSGDTCIILNNKEGLFFSLIDIAGHGKRAYEQAEFCKDFITKNYDDNIIELIEQIHLKAKNHFELVGFFMKLIKHEKRINYINIGNIKVKIFNNNKIHLKNSEGIIGYVLPKLTLNEFNFIDHNILIACTDGIHSFFEFNPMIFNNNYSSKDICNYVINKYYKNTDDAACLAIKI